MINPDNEFERLNDLYKYDILDTPPEKDFELLVQIATEICGCPIAAITFIDKERQWFKAKAGDNVRETPRNISFCAHTIMKDEPMVVEDATKDVRFLNNPDVTGGLGIRFYAGVPIFSSQRRRLGSVCIIAKEPKTITDAQLAALKLISRHVTILLELRLHNKLLSEHSRNAILESEKNFETFFDNSSSPKWIYEIGTLKFLQVNNAAIEKYRYTREEFLQMNVMELRTKEAIKDILQLVNIVKTNDHVQRFKSEHQTKSGEVIDVEVTVRDIVYMGKAARVATIDDITENIHLKKALVDEKDNAGKSITKAEKSAIEDTKEFIGTELHDNVNQILASAKLFLGLAMEHAEMKDDLIKRCHEYISDAINEVRILSKSLIKVEDNEFSLQPSIEKLIGSFATNSEVCIHLASIDNVEVLPVDLKINLFRILQEQLSNILKHAKATEVWVSIDMGDTVVLKIEDNGIGFDTKNPRNGIGLRNMEKRAEFYKGYLEVQSQPGSGTVLKVTVPLKEAITV